MVARSGFQPRNTPAERRAFFDLQRQIGELPTTDDLADLASKTYVDTQNAADRAYVDAKFGDIATCAPQTGWQHYGGGYGQVQVARAGKVVTIAGLIQATVATTGGSAMVVVPSGYRPNATRLAGQMLSTGAMARVDISTTGTMSLNAIPAISLPINGWVALNMSWPIA
jgi:hypothetical protein